MHNLGRKARKGREKQGWAIWEARCCTAVSKQGTTTGNTEGNEEKCSKTNKRYKTKLQRRQDRERPHIHLHLTHCNSQDSSQTAMFTKLCDFCTGLWSKPEACKKLTINVTGTHISFGIICYRFWERKEVERDSGRREVGSYVPNGPFQCLALVQELLQRRA